MLDLEMDERLKYFMSREIHYSLCAVVFVF